MGENTDSPLREDVRLLGEILGDIIRQQEGEVIFELVERVRTLSKAARGGDIKADGCQVHLSSRWVPGSPF